MRAVEFALLTVGVAPGAGSDALKPSDPMQTAEGHGRGFGGERGVSNGTLRDRGGVSTVPDLYDRTGRLLRVLDFSGQFQNRWKNTGCMAAVEVWTERKSTCEIRRHESRIELSDELFSMSQIANR